MSTEWDNKIHQGHALSVLRQMPDGCVDLIVTSPPYWGLRDYRTEPLIWDDPGNCEHLWGEELPEHHPGQVEQTKWPDAEAAGMGQTAKGGRFCTKCGAWIGHLGQEPMFELYIDHLCQIFDQARRILKPTGTLWVVIGDSYFGGKGRSNMQWVSKAEGRNTIQKSYHNICGENYGDARPNDLPQGNIQPKSLMMIPSRFAIAMMDREWILRSEIIWAKAVSLSDTDSGSCMPESVEDRPTSSHEKIFMFAKGQKYHYDQDAVREPLRETSIRRINQPSFRQQLGGEKDYLRGENPNRSARKTLENFANRCRKPDPEDPRSTHGSYKTGHSGFFDSEGNLLTNLNGRNLRNIWRINPEPSRVKHFATYPTRLVQVILDLACPKRACVKCGVPWEPQFARTDIVDPSSKGSRFDKGKTAEHQMGRAQDGERYLRVASGVAPGCECGAGFAPGIVLDPFSGSGTTLVVAKRMGLNYIGIELSERYCEMIRRRLKDEIVSLELFGR